jgi:lysozyme
MNQWKWCLTNSDGKIIKGWYFDNGKWYHLNNDVGVLDTGWFQDKDQRWYYLDEVNGDLKTGWIQLKGVWFFLERDSNGYMGECYVNRTATIDGKSYSFDPQGHLISNSLVSDNCINFVKSFEGFFPNKYYDCVGVLTQGYGMTGIEIANLPNEISEETASNMLKDLINKNYAQVIKDDLNNKGVSLSQNEFDALVSFAYNCGTDALLNQSTLYKNVCNGIRDYNTILGNFQSWSNGGGKRIEGLYRRRTKEANIFLNSDYTGNN